MHNIFLEKMKDYFPPEDCDRLALSFALNKSKILHWNVAECILFEDAKRDVLFGLNNEAYTEFEYDKPYSIQDLAAHRELFNDICDKCLIENKIVLLTSGSHYFILIMGE